MVEREYIEYLESLTRFTFDKAVFKRIAVKRDLVLMPYEQACVDQCVTDMCEIDLLELVVKGSPGSISSSSIQHGNFRQDIGSETVSPAAIERAKDRLRELYRKYGMESEVLSLPSSDMVWLNENSLDV